MGKLIICSGKLAKKPFHVKLTNTNLFSIEELCFFLYNNIELIQKDFFDYSLTEWISQELDLIKRAEILKELLDNNAGLKDMVVCIMCSADFYTETEIKHLLHCIDELGQLSPIEKMKKKADNYLKYRQFAEASIEYEKILESKEAVMLSGVEYGNLVHNLAIIQLNTVGILVAANSFKEAYERNRNIETLKQYLLALKLGKKEDKFLEETKNFNVDEDIIDEINEKLQQINFDAESSEEYQMIEELLEYKQSGKLNQFYQLANERINRWKMEFRRENY
ncbi:MAG: hypothetical protein K0S41_3070 [Anaerocolumna sp.]|jgi:hypothetical protein|nr:hypothetical protein [Anaerocolumna sp.]